MNIAVFADVHGRILLAFKVVERYQRESGEKIDLILQCGDMGIFPDPSRLDKATLRHAEADETELGFRDHFVTKCDEAESVLANVDCKLLCVRGNHEDQQYLDELESSVDQAAFPVDCYGRIQLLKTGVPHVVERDDIHLTVLGIGRVGAPDGETDKSKDKYIQRDEQTRLQQLDSQKIDVLVTHDVRRGFIREGIGCEEIDAVLDRFKPAYHFFGHTGEPFRRMIDVNGTTVSSKLSDFEWEETAPAHPLKSGCLGILRWHGQDTHSFDVVDPPWLREYTRHTWRYV